MSHAGQAATDPRIGMVLHERYRIVGKLGDGGMGTVYEGEHILIKRRVAIKVLHAQFANNPEIVARFQREAQAATSIGHPNIIEVTDMGRFPDGTAYMVLEFLDGRDWSDDLKNEGPQPLGKVAHILTQVCGALEAAHDKGIIHRDMKPENIYLIERSGDPCFAKVLDFGISKIADAAGEDRSLTQTGTALGTPYYMAPEQCQGKKDIDLRADIYSLGVIIFQALTGQYPFDDESYPMLVLKICTEPPPALATYRPDLPPGIEQIVQRMLAKNREHRFSSCAEVKAALAPYLGDTAAPVVVQNAPSTAARGPSVLAAGQGPAVTPTGTAYLQAAPGTPPTATPYPVESEGESSNRGLILAVVAMLGLIVVAGVGIGAFVAFQSASPSDPVVESPHETVPEPAASPPDEAPPEDPALAQVPTPATPAATSRVTIDATPDTATISIAGMESTGHFEGVLDRRSYRVLVTAEGYVTHDHEYSFEIAERGLSIVLERERRRGGGSGGHVASTPVAAPPPPVVHTVQPPPPPPPVERPPPHTRETRGGETVGGRTVFGGGNRGGGSRGSLNNSGDVFP